MAESESAAVVWKKPGVSIEHTASHNTRAGEALRSCATQLWGRSVAFDTELEIWAAGLVRRPHHTKTHSCVPQPAPTSAICSSRHLLPIPCFGYRRSALTTMSTTRAPKRLSSLWIDAGAGPGDQGFLGSRCFEGREQRDRRCLRGCRAAGGPGRLRRRQSGHSLHHS